MITFKQFIAENALARVPYTIFFKKHGYSGNELKQAVDWMIADYQGDDASFADEFPIYQKLLDDFGAEMPYSIAKMRDSDNLEPDEWLHRHIESLVKGMG